MNSLNKHPIINQLPVYQRFSSTALLIIVVLTIILYLPFSDTIQHSSQTSIDSRAQPPPRLELPDFEEPIGNHTVAVGRDAQLSCKINKLGSFRTAWLRVEDKGILTIHSNIITRNYRIGLINNDDGKNFILTIKNVQPSDKGGYMCQINSVPMKFAIGYLDVLVPPVFDENTTGASGTTADNQPFAQPLAPATPGYIIVAEGTNVSLSCRASGHPSPIITWRREDNEPILLNGAETTDGVSKVEGQTLALSSVSRFNSGAYLCIASNGVQPAASKRQLLDVQFSPVIRLPQVEVGAQLRQQEVKFYCFVELNPLGSYHWVKLASNGKSRAEGGITEEDSVLIERDELTNSDKFDIVIKQVNKEKIQMTLTIRRIERTDFGWYKCIARNLLGIQSNSVRLYESSSFSVNSMFTGGLGSSGPLVEEQPADQPASTNTGSINKGKQPTSINNNNNSNQPRAHTRSSWLKNNRLSGDSATPTNALLDSPSSGSSRSFKKDLAQQKLSLLLALLNGLLLASVAQFVVNFTL